MSSYYLPGSKLRSVVGNSISQTYKIPIQNLTGNRNVTFGANIYGSGVFNLNYDYSLRNKIKYLELPPGSFLTEFDIHDAVRQFGKGSYT